VPFKIQPAALHNGGVVMQVLNVVNSQHGGAVQVGIQLTHSLKAAWFHSTREPIK
jgi:hypothetical protein